MKRASARSAHGTAGKRSHEEECEDDIYGHQSILRRRLPSSGVSDSFPQTKAFDAFARITSSRAVPDVSEMVRIMVR